MPAAEPPTIELRELVRDATTAQVRVEERVAGLGNRVQQLEGTVEEGHRTMGGQLGELLGETRRVREILEAQAATRAARLQRADEARAARASEQRQQRTGRRQLLLRIGAEVWGVFRVPLGMLVTAACTYAGWAYFNVPSTPTPVEVEVVSPPG